MDSSSYDAVISDLYQAATGGITWDKALEGVRAAFGARCAPVQTMDLRTGHVIAAYPGGPDMTLPTLHYVREYNQYDPRAAIALARPPGEWLHCSEHLDESFAAKDRFYQEYLASYDSRFVSGIVIPIDSSTASIFGIQLSSRRGPLTLEEREWARRIGDHLREALFAYERVRRLAAQTLAGHTLLSSFAHPMWLIDVDRFVYFSNPASQRELQSACPAVKVGDRFELTSSSRNRELTERLLKLQWAPHGTKVVLSLTRGAGAAPLWLHLSLMVPGKVLGAFGDKPQILVTLFDPEEFTRLDAFAISSMFGLTPAEAKVATQIAQGLSPSDIAVQNGVKLTTVRTQLGQVLAKLGATRQADIARLLSSGSALWSEATVTRDGD